MEGLRLDPTNVDHAFTGTYRRAVHFVLRIGAEVAKYLRDDRLIVNRDRANAAQNPDDFYHSFSHQLSAYVDGILSTIDLARNKQLHYVQKGVVAERLALATELPINIEVIKSDERTKLNQYFIGQSAEILHLRPAERHCLRQRVDFCVREGLRRSPYDCSELSRTLVVNHDEPVRFSQDNMNRISFLEALDDLPKLVGAIC